METRIYTFLILATDGGERFSSSGSLYPRAESPVPVGQEASFFQDPLQPTVQSVILTTELLRYKI